MKRRLIGIISVILALILLVSCGAKTYKVTFDFDGGSGEVEELKVGGGLLLDIPTPPTKEDFVFAYWLNAETEEKWNFGKDKVNKNITLIAIWKAPDPVYYHVRFFTLEGTPQPENQEVLENDKAIKPTDPAKEGYKFLGWFLAEATTPYDFDLEVTEDLIIFAKWEEIVYLTVIFDTLGGLPEISNVVVEKGGKVTEPAEPEKEGFLFVGWFVDDVLFDFSQEITKNVVLTAKWEKIIVYYNVIFYLADDDFFTGVVEEGEKATKPADPEKDGYKFKGWYLNDIKFDFNTSIEADVSLIAVFQKEHLVSFYLDEQLTSEYESEIVLEGELVNVPDEPEMIGHQFLGWFIEEVEYDFNLSVNEDLNIVAKWMSILSYFI